MKKPFYARVAAFTNAALRPLGPIPHVFVIDARVIDGPDVHMNRMIKVQLQGTRQARQLAESLLTWADEKEKWYRDGDVG
jgi:hypothetical protein